MTIPKEEINMSEIRKEKLVESKFGDNSIIELTDEMLDDVNGGVWNYASQIPTNPEWDKAFNSGTWVVWREHGTKDHWCKVRYYVYSGNNYVSFDLECPSEGIVYCNVPASEVLFDCR